MPWRPSAPLRMRATDLWSCCVAHALRDDALQCVSNCNTRRGDATKHSRGAAARASPTGWSVQEECGELQTALTQKDGEMAERNTRIAELDHELRRTKQGCDTLQRNAVHRGVHLVQHAVSHAERRRTKRGCNGHPSF